jgi:hypothetical protein
MWKKIIIPLFLVIGFFLLSFTLSAQGGTKHSKSIACYDDGSFCGTKIECNAGSRKCFAQDCPENCDGVQY